LNAVQVRLLGGFEVEGIELRALGTRKARLLLRRLASAAGRPVGVDELVDAVWGDDSTRPPFLSMRRWNTGGPRCKASPECA